MSFLRTLTRVPRCPILESVNYSGLILAAFIGLGVAWLWQRVGRKMNLPVKGKHWWWVAIAVFIVLCVLFGASHSPK
jgi:hypothetical protein